MAMKESEPRAGLQFLMAAGGVLHEPMAMKESEPRAGLQFLMAAGEGLL